VNTAGPHPDETRIMCLASPLRCVLLLASVCGQGADPGARPPTSLVSSHIERRIVKSFDFDEQKLGNFETMPENWRHIRGPGFPRFLEAGFDNQIGRAAPPSLRLPVSGGSVGAVYLARDINVTPGSEYQVIAWIKPRGLVESAASLSAYYLDHAFHAIPGSERRSTLVRGAGADEPWTRVEVRLPSGVANARWMALACRVDQPPDLPVPPGGAEPPPCHDVGAVAWFDDVTVVRLPRVWIGVPPAGGVFRSNEPVECLVRVADIDGVGIDANLDILDAREQLVRSLRVGVVDPSAPPERLPLSGLPPGYYVAELRVRADSTLVAVERQAFIRLNPDLVPGGQSTPLGLVLDASAAGQPTITRQMISLISPRFVKFPVWRSETTDRTIVAGDPQVDRLMRYLDDRNVDVIATIESPPRALLARLGKPDAGLLQLLNSPAEEWRAYLALVLTRYGGQVKAWQVGTDDGPTSGEEALLGAALENLRSELRPLLGDSRLVAPIRGAWSVRSVLPADVLSVRSPAGLARQDAGVHSGDGIKAASSEHWVSIEPLPAERFRREARLADLAQRVTRALSGRAGGVFVPQPWRMIQSDEGWRPVPDEALMVLRTLSQALAGRQYAADIWLDHAVDARLFTSTDGSAALIAWCQGATAEPRLVPLDAGPRARRIDLWGNVGALNESGADKMLELSDLPVVIAPVDADRMRLMAGFETRDSTIRPNTAPQPVTVRLTNPLRIRLSGTIRLEPPPRWQIEPARLRVDLPAGQSAEWTLRIRIPANQTIGDFALASRLASDRPELDGLLLRAPISVRPHGLEVSVLARRDGADVVVMQRITNRGEALLDLRATLIGAGAARQARLIQGLAAGQTAIREYRLAASDRVGRFVRSLVEEIDGPIRCNVVTRIE